MNPDSSDQRAQLAQALWDLRCAIARRGDSSANRVSFGRMLTDPGYRARVLVEVQKSGIDELRAAAERAAALNKGSLAESPVSWESAGRTELDIPEITGVGNGAKRGASISVIGASMAVLLFAIAGGVLSYLFSDPLRALMRGEERVSGEISQDTTWRADRTYVLDDIIYVVDDATLRIERGTEIRGTAGSALVVTSDARIQAQGTRDAPIVFTSAKPSGERQPGDWGGVVVLGRAPTNKPAAHVEGIPQDDPRGDFGGKQPSQSCGALRYVRIEFAGFELARDSELNALTLGGCGSDTVVRYVQTHMGLDDGVEVFGGTVDLDHIVSTRSGDDALDWQLGWTGRAQFVVLQQAANGNDGIEADNLEGAHNVQPRSTPTLSNVTLIGPSHRRGDQRALRLRRGTGGDLRNLIIARFPRGVLDIEDSATVEQIKHGGLHLKGLIAHDTGRDGDTFALPERGVDDDDGGFNEPAYLSRVTDRLGVASGLFPSANNPENPRFAPPANSPAASGAAAIPEGEFWDRGASYLGAVEPGTQQGWLPGWTSFEMN